ncbi:acetyl/propionyl/methylcrotonyl-CoA carboxylase subunit alpha [Halioxenophilus aromaticivorans]|uniref:Biotin carboxylase n=1 Tax=Halioxenophilus aromaticivorans TaxID=1306992 RepID=A0AAV3TWL4_9ALTE
MFDKILIANRGEIACRVIKTARQMGIATVAVYSDADVNALHVTMADEAIHIGAAPSKESYLLGDKIIAAALKTGSQAIHPGYGFLSENADFCRACADNNLVFIGPPTGAIEAMGSKSAAKRIMEAAEVPLVPGYHGEDQSPSILKASADDMGYPVLLKATAGGGGKGMRQVWSADEFDEALAAAKREATNSFGDDRMLVEKYLTRPRHVEIQVFCDSLGNAVYLAERDCSVQRRHQKVIEEAPAPGMTPELRDKMGQAAIQAAEAIDYVGAGTVEFLLDVDDSFYFMEMNTRLQVEHPVTEMITGQDLVQWQLLVAAGQPLPLSQSDVVINGHAFEARIYAEDPANDFLPVTGNLSFLQPPSESKYVRVDTGVLEGDDVSVYYDPMIAKLIVWDEDRERALQRLQQALGDYRIGGMTTNVAFLNNLISTEPFKQADLDTGFIEKHRELIFAPSAEEGALVCVKAALYLHLALSNKKDRLQASDPYSPWAENSAWRMNETHHFTYDIALGEDITTVSVQATGAGWSFTLADQVYSVMGQLHGQSIVVTIDGHRSNYSVANLGGEFALYTDSGMVSFALVQPETGAEEDLTAAGGLVAPMNGTVVTLLVEQGAQVAKGTPLMVMEAMKMEHTIKAPYDGTVESFYFTPGELVEGGAELLAFQMRED